MFDFKIAFRLIKNQINKTLGIKKYKKSIGLSYYHYYKTILEWRKRENKCNSFQYSEVWKSIYMDIFDYKGKSLHKQFCTKISPEGYYSANINEFVNNNIKYTTDQELFGKKEHWDTSAEVFENKKADCDGMAILKFKMLLLSGVKEIKPFLTVIDKHMFCSMYLNDEWFILDNGHLSHDIIKMNDQIKYRIIVNFDLNKEWI